jgi:hypothetical protein
MHRDHRVSRVKRGGGVTDPSEQDTTCHLEPEDIRLPMRTLVLLSLVSAGCTTWSAATSFGPAREVGRRLKGQPSLATSSSSSMSGGFAGASFGNVVVAGYGSGSQSYTRTHCVQEAEVAYEQSYEIHPVEIGRSKDKLAGLALAAGGVLMILAGVDAENDPYTEADATGAYAFGGGLIAGGVGLLVYSYTALPREPRPEVQRGTNRWVTSHTVEAEGCAPLPVPTNIAQGGTTVVVQPSNHKPGLTERLAELDRLKASGTINDAEYKRKRAQILNEEN